MSDFEVHEIGTREKLLSNVRKYRRKANKLRTQLYEVTQKVSELNAKLARLITTQ